MSELGLFQSRARVQAELLLAFSEHPQIPVRVVTDEERKYLHRMHRLKLKDGKQIKLIEEKGTSKHGKTNHDVQALILHLRDLLELTTLADVVSLVHFAGTSEDTNNIAYALQLRGALKVLLKSLEEIISMLKKMARANAFIAMLSQTHGQPASPTTFGKEMNVFAKRLQRQVDQVKAFRILVKYNGSVGNYNPHVAALPNVDWLTFSISFIERFNVKEKGLMFEPNLFTTQIESHDTYAELFDIFKRINTILIDMCQDLWSYISDNWIVQAVDGVGSSAMPQKVNPINIENGEGNAYVASWLMEGFSKVLPISRRQRHLSDSTIIRNFGVACGHALISYRSIVRGLRRYSVNEKVMLEALNAHPEVISEALQNILRREGNAQGHQLIEKAVQGKKVTIEDIHDLINTLPVSAKVKAEMLAITPSNYIGLAPVLAKM